MPALFPSFSQLTSTTPGKLLLAPWAAGLSLYLTSFTHKATHATLVWKARGLKVFPWTVAIKKLFIPFLGPLIIPTSLIYFGIKSGQALAQRLEECHIKNPTLNDILEMPYYQNHPVRSTLLRWNDQFNRKVADIAFSKAQKSFALGIRASIPGKLKVHMNDSSAAIGERSPKHNGTDSG